MIIRFLVMGSQGSPVGDGRFCLKWVRCRRPLPEPAPAPPLNPRLTVCPLPACPVYGRVLSPEPSGAPAAHDARPKGRLSENVGAWKWAEGGAVVGQEWRLVSSKVRLLSQLILQVIEINYVIAFNLTMLGFPTNWTTVCI